GLAEEERVDHPGRLDETRQRLPLRCRELGDVDGERGHHKALECSLELGLVQDLGRSTEDHEREKEGGSVHATGPLTLPAPGRQPRRSAPRRSTSLCALGALPGQTRCLTPRRDTSSTDTSSTLVEGHLAEGRAPTPCRARIAQETARPSSRTSVHPRR